MLCKSFAHHSFFILFIKINGHVSVLNGLGGTDTLVGDGNGNAFVVTGANAGTLAGKTSGWTGIENIRGGASNDTFAIQGSGSVVNLDGNGGSDTIDLAGTVAGTIAGSTVRITANGGVGSVGNAQEINVTNLSLTASGNVFLDEANNLLIGSIEVGGNNFALNVGGSVNDATAGGDEVVDIRANRIILNAQTGIGNSARLELVTTTLEAETSTGNIDLANSGSLQVNSLRAASGNIQLFTVGDLTIGRGVVDVNVGGSNSALNIVSAGGNVRLAADPANIGSFDFIQQGGIAARTGKVILLASNNVLAKNPENVISVAQAPFVIDTPNLEMIALNGFIGSTNGVNQTDAAATTAREFFVSQGGVGEAFLIANFLAISATSSSFDQGSLFGGLVTTIFGSSSVTNSAAAQASAAAGESQNADAGDEGYIDPALYDLALNIFDIIEPGLSLPADQLEEDTSSADLGGDLGDDDVGLEIEEFGSDDIDENFGELEVGAESELFDGGPESELLEGESQFEPLEPEFEESFEDPALEFSPGFDESIDEEDSFNLEQFEEELEGGDDNDDEEEFDGEFDLEGLDLYSSNSLISPTFQVSMKTFFDSSLFWGKQVVTLTVNDPKV